MANFPTEFYHHLEETLLGRLRLKALYNISGSEGKIPEPKQVKNYLLELHRSNQLVCKIFTFLLDLKMCRSINYEEVRLCKDVKGLIVKLQDKSVKTPDFVQINNCPPDLPATLGILITSSNLVGGGYVYEIALIEEDSFPDLLAGYYEVSASKANPVPMFSVTQETGEFLHYDLETYQAYPLLELSLGVLEHIETDPILKFEDIKKLIRLEKSSELNLVKESMLSPPIDNEYMARISKAKIGLIPFTKAIAPLELIQPYDLDFCLSYPLHEIGNHVCALKSGNRPELLVYWDGNCFIMSDDYPSYLAYRKLLFQEIPVVLMGPFPKSKVRVIKKGGFELCPAAGIQYSQDLSNLDPAIKNWMLDRRLKEMTQPDHLTKLYAMFLGLSQLLQNSRTLEKHLHKFLLENPVIIDPNLLYIKSEVNLGNKYRIDLVVQYNYTNRQILLIELESSNIRIFTKTGRPTAKVTHAIQQVEDWLRFWNEEPSKIPKPIDPSIPPEGLVVVGRSEMMDHSTRSKLLHLNHNRRVKVITYDDLLDQIKNLINLIEEA